jgi:predicted metal-dependent enzyme (double-stranded beta helix superfamily)
MNQREDRRGDSTVGRREVLLGSAALLAAPACRSTRETRSVAMSTKAAGTRLDLERFVADCVAANRENDPQRAVREVLARGVSDPGAMLKAVGEPSDAGIGVLHRSPTLTIFTATWAPRMCLMPHDHRMWALIGLYTGREDNIFWHRSEKGVTAHGAEALFEGDVAVLPADVIHSVTNPLERLSGGVHIYGGDFFATVRSQWDPETRVEEPADGETIRAIFERANERMRRERES